MVPEGLCSSMRGRSNQRVQARMLSATVRAVMKEIKAGVKGLLDAAFPKPRWPLEKILIIIVIIIIIIKVSLHIV